MPHLSCRRSLEEREYAAASDQLRVVLNIMDEFQKYKHVDKVQELERRWAGMVCAVLEWITILGSYCALVHM